MTEDICRKIIEYGRHHIVGNEAQFLSVILCLATAYSKRPNEYVPSFIVGELSGGKTHLQNIAHRLFNPAHQHNITSASDKALIYSDALRDNDEIRIIKLGEYQKLGKPILEYMKSLSGDDAEFVYEVTVQGTTERIPQPKRVYTVTYAQVDIDPELESRVFVTPIVENYKINRCVAALKFGATSVEYLGHQYKFEPCTELQNELMSSIESLGEVDMDVVIPYTYALIDMVNHSKAVSKRHANIISSMIKASARLNWMNRDLSDGVIVANAQDVANILVMFDLFRATTMSIDYIDMTIYRRLCTNPQQSEESLTKHLQICGLAELTRVELNRRLDKLYNENYVTRETSANGYSYSSNPHKQVIELKVDWDIIWELDKSEIVDILTGNTFDDIKAYGEYIEGEFAVKELDAVPAVSSSNISEKEAGIMSCVRMWLSEPNNNTTRTGIANGILNEPDYQGRLMNATYFDVVDVLKQMETSGHIKQLDDKYILTGA